MTGGVHMLFENAEISMVVKASKENPRNSEASVIRCRDGSLLMAWQCYEESDKGSGDAGPNTIHAMRSFDEGRTWEQDRVLIPRPENCVNLYSPNFIRLRDGAIGLVYMKYVQLETGKPQLASIYFAKSYDEGESFPEVQTLSERDRYTVSNDCLRRLSSGRLLISACLSSGEVWTATDHHSVGILYSDDDGATWQHSEAVIDLPMRGAMEPFVAEGADGTLVMVMRNQLGSLFRSYSCDQGITWTKPQTTGLPVPESCPYITRVPGSEAMLVIWNNSEYDMHWASHYGKRTPLTVAVTYDNARTFSDFFDIETDPNRAFSNPGSIWLSDHELLLNYWTCPYSNTGRMSGVIDLKQAIISLDRTKLAK